MASGDLYLVTLFGAIFGNQTVNTFTYLQTGEESSPGVSAAILGALFKSAFLPADAILRGEGIAVSQQWKGIRVVNQYEDSSDFFEEEFPTPFTGDGIGAVMPPYVTYAFRTPWLGPAVRRGQKRFSGVLELEVNNGILQANVTTLLNPVAQALGMQLEGDNEVYTPVIVRRVKTLDPETGRYVYSLPSNPTQYYGVAATSWSVQAYSSTQNSRKYGRGA